MTVQLHGPGGGFVATGQQVSPVKEVVGIVGGQLVVALLAVAVLSVGAWLGC